MYETTNKLMNNWKRFCDDNPDIREAIKDGYEVAAYDEETAMIITVELVNGDLKIKIIEYSHVIKNNS